MPTVSILGPQRRHPIVKAAVDERLPEGPVATITAGWEEREHEDDELSAHLGRETVNLHLFIRVEQAFREDPDLHQAVITRHDRLRDLQRLYRLRLHHALAAARELFARRDDPELLLPERADAMAAVASLDGHHLERVRQVHAQFNEQWTPESCAALGRARSEVEEQLERCSGVAIAGGHVVVLLNRLRLLNMAPLLAGRPLVAWSAGAMVLTRQVVLFHDSPPQGFGDPEVLESGLGLCPGVVALPHARRRLRLNDPVRVAIFARRFDPDTCVALDENCRADWNGTEWRTSGRTRRLDLSGNIMKMTAP